MGLPGCHIAGILRPLPGSRNVNEAGGGRTRLKLVPLVVVRVENCRRVPSIDHVGFVLGNGRLRNQQRSG